MFFFSSNAVYIFVFLYEKRHIEYHLFLALKHGQSEQVEKKLRYIQVLCYSFFLLIELVFALREDISLQSPTHISKFGLFQENEWVFCLCLVTSTQVLTNSCNQCMPSFVKSFDSILLGSSEMLKLA